MASRVRRALAAGLRRRLWAAAARPTATDMAAPALVVAPHPDDEALGCGGTIAAKRAAGAAVRVVFVSDGSGSHDHLVGRDGLAARRRREALAAAVTLGLSAEDVTFLDLEDGRLADLEAEGARALGEQLARRPVAQVFAPYASDPLADHVATARMVRRALERVGAGTTLFEYAVWLWNCWPFVPRRAPGPAPAPSLAQSLATLRRLRRDFRLAVPIEAHLARKQAALACHSSQMVKPDDRPDWPILADVGAGELLESLTLQPFELFRRSVVAGRFSPASGGAAGGR